MKVFALCLFVFLLVIIAWLASRPLLINAQPWTAPKAPNDSGIYAKNHQLDKTQLIKLPEQKTGAEAIAIDNNGNMAFATSDGSVFKSHVNQLASAEFIPSGQIDGRPLGVKFGHDGKLIFADAINGLIEYQDNQFNDLIDNQAFGFVDDLAIASDGKIYFSDATHRQWLEEAPDSAMHASQYEVIEHAGNGSLYVYDPATQAAEELLGGLTFSNGVTLSQDESYILINETGSYRVMRYWLKGDKAGSSDVFIDNLPGFPDNITTAPDGGYWLALFAPRSPLLDVLANYPSLRNWMSRLPPEWAPKGKVSNHVLKLNAEGEVIASLQEANGILGHNTSAIEYQGKLYLGSLDSPYIGIYDLP